LMPASRPELITYAPRRPDVKVEARIISVYGGVGTGGRYSVVALSKGSRDHLSVGHVLALLRGEKQYEQRNEQGGRELVTVPPQRYGLVFVFRVFEKMSYALVMDAALPLSLADLVRNP
ncbi:MAG TPA: peptidoglycan-binding protein, partial [Azospira sp.]|nr:peptidoglycan-binding protein [Azospira sp.]